jgi:formylglycine-generating enzyme required for sulfatase activity
MELFVIIIQDVLGPIAATVVGGLILDRLLKHRARTTAHNKGKSSDFMNGSLGILQGFLLPCVVALNIWVILDFVGKHRPPVPSAPNSVIEGRDFTNGLGQRMIWCLPGSFLMGSPVGEVQRNFDERQRQVVITSGFWMSATEVTKVAWADVMGGGRPAETGWKRWADGPGYPAVQMTWAEAVNFCDALTRREGAAGRLPQGFVYRLPTEAQWEYACRAGSSTAFSFGGTLDGRDANCDGREPYGTTRKGRFLGRSAFVGRYPRNPWGLLDMHGNVQEWCLDWYAPDLGGSTSLDPRGPVQGTSRVVRGGCWFVGAAKCRSAARFKLDPKLSFDDLGMRPALVKR